ncbi:MAG TPA: membrane protein insertase YidC [Opitutaceae bacterium]|nr:membrane protein insertase YidC [Opitutaceae bacterium]
MDKKNTVIGIILVVGAFVCFWLSTRFAPQAPPPAPEIAQPAGPSAPAAPTTMPAETTLRAGPAAPAPAATATLENDFITVTFTNAGGAIDRVALKKYPAVQDRPEPYVINAVAAAPALSFRDAPGIDAGARYELVSQTPTEIVYRAVLPGQLEVTRRYTLAAGGGNGQDPYQLAHETTFRNLGDQLFTLPRTGVSVGTAAPINADDYGLHLNVGYHDGDDFETVGRGKLEGGGFFSNFGIGSKVDLPFIQRDASVAWASVKNTFFATILTPENPGLGVRVERLKTDAGAPDSERRAYGVAGWAQFDFAPVPAGGTTTWKASFYAGPKEYKRLSDAAHFKKNEHEVMEFSAFFFNRIFLSGVIAPLLISLMGWVHELGISWGWSVVVVTIILKTVTLPFTLAASRSGKRMAKLMPHMQALREKYKDNPAKLNEGMLKLYRENKVNPLGGCIPILITIPFFIGFFSMLQSASELRFQEFLWAADLSAPDTVLRIRGFPLNIMPLLMGATMIVQMRLTPTPTTDPAQQMMMKIMPVMFTVFCYNFSCALALYSTVNGLYTICQQLIVNRLPEPQLPIDGAGTAAGGGGGMKNVTPRKKK